VLEELQVPREDVQLSCPDDARAHADPMHLHQILANLLTNAQKYGAPPYVIDVRTRADTCVITFRDHGAGIPESFREQLFEPFTQADSGDRRTSAGTGLGLAIVRNLIHANGGTITHDPQRPGASFKITLPVDETESSHPGRDVVV
jgi:signal transduction histidine kinase